jgi:hypothetical protein
MHLFNKENFGKFSLGMLDHFFKTENYFDKHVLICNHGYGVKTKKEHSPSIFWAIY